MTFAPSGMSPAGPGPDGGEGGLPRGDVAASPPGSAGHLDATLLAMSFARFERESDRFMAHFFADLFARHPQLRAIFPLTMDSLRRRVFAALARAVAGSDSPQALARWLAELALDHRRYGVTADHYRLFFDVLLETVRVFSGDAWTPDLAGAWEGTLGYTCAVMTDAATGAQAGPPWWLAEVTGHDLRRPDLAVLTLRPDAPLPYRPGQHIGVQVPQRPRVWREYSIANAPRPDGLIRLHVRAIPGGVVSTVLVHQTRPGDTLVVGRARGAVTADAFSSRAILCVAGGTGLAPIKALAEAFAQPGLPPPHPGIHLLVGARHEDDLYDLPSLRRLAAAHPALTVTPVISHDPGYRGVRGMLPEVAARCLPPATGDVVISGPPPMVTRTAAVVAAVAPGVRVHSDLPGEVAAPGPDAGTGLPARP